MTSVWPALWPPWKRTTISACSDNQSTILPFPSSPHWAPTTTTLAISKAFPANLVVSTWPFRKTGLPFSGSCASLPSQNHGRGRSHARQPHRIKEAGALGKQEGGFRGVLEPVQPIDIPVKFLTTRRETH